MLVRHVVPALLGPEQRDDPAQRKFAVQSTIKTIGVNITTISSPQGFHQQVGQAFFQCGLNFRAEVWRVSFSFVFLSRGSLACDPEVREVEKLATEFVKDATTSDSPQGRPGDHCYFKRQTEMKEHRHCTRGSSDPCLVCLFLSFDGS